MPSGNVRVRIEIASVSMGLGTVTVSVSGSGAAVTAAAGPKVTTSSEAVTGTSDCAAELGTGRLTMAVGTLMVRVEKAVNSVTVVVRGPSVLWEAGPAVPEEVQDDETEAINEELAEMKPGRAPDVIRADDALVLPEVTVTVTTLGIGDDLATDVVACPRTVVEQLELTRAVVADSRVAVKEVDLGSTAVASTAFVPEQVVSRASSLAEISARFQ
jgi:hypothetical protein